MEDPDSLVLGSGDLMDCQDLLHRPLSTVPCPKSRKPEVSKHLRTTPSLYPELKVHPRLYMKFFIIYKVVSQTLFDLYNFMRLVEAMWYTSFPRGEKTKAPKRLEEWISTLRWWQCVCASVLSHSVMSDSSWPMDCSLLGSSIHGIFQVRILECHALLQRNLSNQGIEPGSPALQADSLPSELPGKTLVTEWGCHPRHVWSQAQCCF